MTTPPAQLRDFVRELRRLRRDVDRLRAVGPQLPFSSLEDGAVPVYDIDGQNTAVIGKQVDGTWGAVTVAGPVPPTPTGYTYQLIPGGVKVVWAGEFEQPADVNPLLASTPVVAPLDWSRAEVHISENPAMTGLLFSTLEGTIESPRGGTVTPIVDFDKAYYLTLVARSTSGKTSAPGPVLGPFTVPRWTKEQLDIDWDELGGNTIFYTEPGDPDPVADKIGDLWLDTIVVSEEGVVEHVAYRYAGAVDGWVQTRDQGVVEALLTAQQAATDADNAGIAALAALNTANGKVTLYRQASPPSGGTYTASVDLWIDSDDNQIYVWTGAWTVSSDTRIAAALTNAATAQSTADGKMRIFPQASAPTGLVAGDVGDMWIDIDDDNKSYTWALVSGSTYGWVARQVGTAALKPNSIVASTVIATGTISAALFEALMILANVIIVGAPLGEHVRIDPALGLVAYAADPVDGVPNELSRFGRNSGGRNPATGEQTWNIDELGNITGNTISVRDMPVVAGMSLAEHFQRRSEGLIALAYPGRLQGNAIAQFGVLELQFAAREYRDYRLVVNVWGSSTVNNGEIAYRVYMTTDGSRPTTNSTLIAERTMTIPVGTRAEHMIFDSVIQRAVGAAANVKLLLTFGRGPGQSTGTVMTTLNGATMHVYDEGILTFASGTNTNDGNPAGSSTPTAVRHDELYFATWAQDFKGSGAIRTDTTDLVQGLDPSGNNGDGKACIGFQDLASVLSGAASIEAIILSFYVYQTYESSGGEAILGTHGYTSAPATFGAPNIARWRVPIARAQAKSVDLTGVASEFQSGAIRGFTFGPSNSGNLFYYARYLGASDMAHIDLRPSLRLVYYK